ncbi:two-component response regulator ARR18-like [Diospyros lotus]|uniref:two-component response regulator ARR18-like n=1 Tax=Diospyros lotus TaxID=55363 RepID=UPI0022511FFC|nr:two-component response regulator ARR18-like [Diospyros lotus]
MTLYPPLSAWWERQKVRAWSLHSKPVSLCKLKKSGIIVVHEDPMYSKLMTDMHQYCNHYEVLKFGSLIEALTAIKEKKDSLNLIITNVHQSNTEGIEILQYIEKQLNIPVISMPPSESTRLASVELSRATQLYLVKSLSVSNFKVLWQRAHEKAAGKATSDPSVSLVQAGAIEARVEDTSSFFKASRAHQNQNRIEAGDKHDKSEESSRDDFPRERKPRIVWTDLLHNKFLEAVDILWPDMAFLNKVLEVMNVPGLTKENVASHLQKYRACMKRAQQMQWAASCYGISLPTRLTEPSFPPSLSSIINDLQNPRFKPFQPLFSNNNSMASLDYSRSFLRAASTTSSIFSNLGNKEWLTGSSTLNQNLLKLGTAPIISPTAPTQVDQGHAPDNTILPGLGQLNLGHAPFSIILPGNTEISSTSLGQGEIRHALFNTFLPSNAEISSTGLEQVCLGHAPDSTILPGNLKSGGSFSNGNQVPSSSTSGTDDLFAKGGNLVVKGSQKVLLSGNDENIIDTANLPAEGRKFIELGEKDFSGNADSIIENANLPVEGGKSSEKVFPDNAKSRKEKVFPGNGQSSKEATNLADNAAKPATSFPRNNSLLCHKFLGMMTKCSFFWIHWRLCQEVHLSLTISMIPFSMMTQIDLFLLHFQWAKHNCR